MKPLPNPPRLISSPEFGELMKTAANHAVNEARLQHSYGIVQAALSSPVAPAVGSGAAATTAAHVGTHATVGAKIGITFAVGLGASVGVYAIMDSNRQPEKPVVIEQPALEPAVETVEPEIESENPPDDNTPKVAKSKRRHLNKRVTKPLPKSVIAEQLRLFHAAQRAARSGRTQKALSMLDELERRYPHGPLEAEIIVSRAEYLFLASRNKEAAALIERELRNPIVSARRTDLLLMLGDVRLRQGVCEQAITAYQRALGLGLRDSKAEAARRGIRRCTP